MGSHLILPANTFRHRPLSDVPFLFCLFGLILNVATQVDVRLGLTALSGFD